MGRTTTTSRIGHGIGAGTSLPAAVIALGASAGGVDALSAVVASLPADIDAAVLVVLHISPRGPSVLPEILQRASGLPTKHAVDGEILATGHIYVAPPDRHLAIDGDLLRVTDGPRENGVRPSVDVLFRSVARHFGERAIVVVLSGMLDDGTAGAIEVKRRLGTVVVQDPAEAMFPAMPTSAAAHSAPDHVVALSAIGPLLGELAAKWSSAGTRGAEAVVDESDPEVPSEFTCPDCGGTLFHHEGANPLHFRCRVGHAYSPESLLLGKEAALEAALWAAVVALEERGDLTRRISRRMSGTGGRTGERYLRQANETDEQAVLIRELLASIKRDQSVGEAP